MNATASPGVYSLAILNEKLNAVLAANHKKHVLRVGSGMDSGKLLREATAHNMSVQVRHRRGRGGRRRGRGC